MKKGGKKKLTNPQLMEEFFKEALSITNADWETIGKNEAEEIERMKRESIFLCKEHFVIPKEEDLLVIQCLIRRYFTITIKGTAEFKTDLDNVYIFSFTFESETVSGSGAMQESKFPGCIFIFFNKK